jgi:hypothetical protein
VPVDGRFEHIVFSCNATSDHSIISIEREAQRAMDVSFQFLGIKLILFWFMPSFKAIVVVVVVLFCLHVGC